jgi:methyl-accepting chemotaxis protein
MFKNWTFSKRLFAGFGLAGLTLLLTALLAYRNTETLVKNNNWVNHTQIIRNDLTDLLIAMTNAETGQRGYVITGRETYLEPYHAGLATSRSAFEEVRRLTADSPVQQQRLATLLPLIDAKLAELKMTIELRKNQGFNASEQVVTGDAGKIFMDQIRAIIAEMDREEMKLLARRTSEAEASVHLATTIIIWGGALGAIVVGVIGWLVTLSLSRQIGGAIGQVQSSSAELQAAANQQATGAREQATAMTEIATTISELLVTSRQIAESAQRVAQIAEQTVSAASLGHGTVDQTNDSISGIRQQVDQIVAHMLELGKKSQEIGTVLDIVAELAEQTNILAINATIEAAGAGESGKRFAVVADEIRKLADRVSGSTKEIRSLIDDVRSAVNTTVMATETGSKAVDAGTRKFADVAATFKKITTLVSTTTDAAREIGLSTKQQSTAVEQVNIAIANVAQASKETETSASQTFATASQLATLSRDLTQIIRSQTARLQTHGA